MLTFPCSGFPAYPMCFLEWDCFRCVVYAKLSEKVKKQNIDFINKGGKGDWSMDGCSIKTVSDAVDDQDVVICKCSHLSTLGVFVVSFSNLHQVQLFPVVIIGSAIWHTIDHRHDMSKGYSNHSTCVRITTLAALYCVIHQFIRPDLISGN
jgi:hypothetical protein